MRLALSVIFIILIISLGVCMFFSLKARKPVSRAVAFLIAGMAMPVIGNLILISSSNGLLSTAGYYIYFIGMDMAVLSSWYFTYIYCELGKPKKVFQIPLILLFGADVLHYILNPFIKCSFGTVMIYVEDRAYFKLIPYIGQVYHRIICYGLFFAVLTIFFVKMVKAAKVYKEKYRVMLYSMIVTVGVETYYIFSRQPLDISMVGFGIFGLLVYFFALKYRPLKLLDRMLAGMASEMQEALFFFDKSGKCIWTNEPGRQLIGVSENNFDDVKDNLKFLFGEMDLDGSGWSKRVTLGTGDEAQYTFLSMKSVINDRKKVIGSYLSVRDITEEQLEMKREMYRSTHDSLTGLYTKEYLYENISKRLEEDRKTDYMVGYIEVSNYKVINDVFGRRFGELTLRHIAGFIDKSTSKKCIYGRISDDAFGILLDRPTFNDERVEKLLSNFTVRDENLEHHILIHIGLYHIEPGDELDVPTFFDSAHLATTMIKDSYRHLIAYYDDKLRNEIIHNQLISNQVKDAIRTKQIRPYLQPIVDSKGLLAGAEALVRWIHPDEGFMNPGMFIPLFEQNGLIADVDRYMWRCACELLSNWKSRGIESFISVNISPRDFYYMDVISELKKLVDEYGIDPVRLRVEITETVMATESIDILKIVEDLRACGFIVEMDDFGSGYSSLNLLKDINIDVIKIDMQFLKDSERNMKANTIIKNIISMSEELEIDTLTEGVETAKQFEKLYAMGCKLYQGYYFSKPVPVEDFEKQWFD